MIYKRSSGQQMAGSSRTHPAAAVDAAAAPPQPADQPRVRRLRFRGRDRRGAAALAEVVLHPRPRAEPGQDPRFRTVLLVVARQSGKTRPRGSSTLYRMYVSAPAWSSASPLTSAWPGRTGPAPSKSSTAARGCSADLAGVRYANGDETINLGLADLEYDDVDGDESATLARGPGTRSAPPTAGPDAGWPVDLHPRGRTREMEVVGCRAARCSPPRRPGRTRRSC